MRMQTLKEHHSQEISKLLKNIPEQQKVTGPLGKILELVGGL